MDSAQTLTPPLGPRGPASSSGALVHGRYRLRERLGAGGFGVVWSAEDELLHREVALKRIPLPPAQALADEDDGPRAGERAGREALAAARLSHPAIVALYEAYVEDDAFYLVSELVHGRTLAELIATGELSDEQVMQIGVTLTDALAHAHARGVIHRDVKPQNVLVPDDEAEPVAIAKLTDFGGARLSGEDALTRTGETLGTLAYMAPEQSEGIEVGEETDVYALALVLYEALAGINPVRGATPAATARHVGRPLPPLGSHRPDLPSHLSESLDAALAIDPHERATLPRLRSALEQALVEGLPTRRFLRRSPRARVAPPREPEGEQWPENPSRTWIAPVRAWRSAPAPPTPLVTSHPVEDRFARPPKPLGEDGESALPVERALIGDRIALPRALWLGGALALAVWQAASGRPGLGLLILALAAPLLLAGRRPGVWWLAGALAPLLGVVGPAGAYPALAGQAARWTRRAALGATGYWWLTLCECLLAGSGTRGPLWLAPPAGTPARAVWEGSLPSAATHVIAPALSTGVLLGAALWAAGAAVLPWVVRGRRAVLDVVASVVWSAALCAAAPLLDAGVSAHAPFPQPHGATLGAVLGGAIAIAARALRGPV